MKNLFHFNTFKEMNAQRQNWRKRKVKSNSYVKKIILQKAVQYSGIHYILCTKYAYIPNALLNIMKRASLSYLCLSFFICKIRRLGIHNIQKFPMLYYSTIGCGAEGEGGGIGGITFQGAVGSTNS